MADKWDKYIVEDTDTSEASSGDKWEQYVVENKTEPLYSQRAIPQFVKAAYNYAPFGKRVINAMPNAEEIKSRIAMTGPPENVQANLGAFVGKNAFGLGSAIPMGLISGSAMYAASMAPGEGKSIPEEALKGAAIGAVTGAVGKGISKLAKGIGVGSFSKVIDSKKGAAFANKIRSEFVNVKVKAVKAFEKTLDDLVAKSPETKVPLKGVVDDISVNIHTMPQEIKSVLNKTPYLKDMLKSENPLSPDTLNVKQVQEITNYLNTKVPKNIRANNLDLLDVISDIKAAQLEAFPTEMAAARSSYAKMIEPFNNVKNQFKFNKVLSAIENNFGGAEGKEAVKGLLPKSVVDEMGGYKNAYETLKHLRALAPWLGIATGAGAAGYVGGKLIQGATNPR